MTAATDAADVVPDAAPDAVIDPSQPSTRLLPLSPYRVLGYILLGTPLVFGLALRYLGDRVLGDAIDMATLGGAVDTTLLVAPNVIGGLLIIFGTDLGRWIDRHSPAPAVWSTSKPAIESVTAGDETEDRPEAVGDDPERRVTSPPVSQCRPRRPVADRPRPSRRHTTTCGHI